MKTDHIPILSYVFIGVTSLVLTYATIADTTNEIILPPTLAEPEPDVAPDSQSSSVLSSIKEIELPSLSGTIEKLKSINPFSNVSTVSGTEAIPVAVAVAAPSTPSAPPLPSGQAAPINKFPSSGGKKSIKNRKRKQKKTRRSSK
jgi:hypothetical protein